MKKVLSVLAALAMGTMVLFANGAAEGNGASSGSETSQKSVTLRFATDSSEDYVSTVQIKKFAAEVEEKTNGRVKIEVYAGGQLGEEKVCVEQVQMGGIDITKSSMGALTGFNSKLNILSMPFLFRSEDHLWKVMDSDIGQKLLDSMDSVGLIGLGWLDAGSRCFYAKKPLRTIDDFKGLKIRVMQSPIYTDMVKCIGGVPIAMAGSEVYSALQTGVIDAAENNIPRIIDMSHNELCKYCILDRHNIMPEMVIMSKTSMEKLSAEDQAVIREAAKNLQKNMIAAWNETEQAAMKKLEESGMTFVDPSPEVLKQFSDAMAPVYDTYGADFKDDIARIQNM